MNLLRIFLVSWLMVSTAFAQELKLNYPFEPVATNINGKAGVFFPVKDTEYLLYLRTSVIPDLVAKTEAQKLVLDLGNTRVADLTAKVALVEKKYEIELKAQEACSVELTKCLNKPNAWYMHPALWIGVGLVAGVGSTIAIMKAVK
jgi:hypothetical protein